MTFALLDRFETEHVHSAPLRNLYGYAPYCRDANAFEIVSCHKTPTQVACMETARS